MSDSPLKGKVILITGATGSFGAAMIQHLLASHDPRTIRVFSRDEFKQAHLQRRVKSKKLRFFLGDVRDRDRIKRACEGVDIIFHAAALKQVPACEYNPFEAIQTNIMGAMNVVDAAIDCGVSKVLNISSDKAVNPVNLYGATKLCAEKVFIHGNSYSGKRGTRLACVRYGNVIGSRGSVLPLFLDQKKEGVLTVTDNRMTRFWINLEAAVNFVTTSLSMMAGGEIFIPKIPSMRVVELARTIAPEAKIREIGIRPGEKLHELLIMPEESRHSIDCGDRYVILPEWFHTNVKRTYKGEAVAEEFTYSSETNTEWMSEAQIHDMVSEYEEKHAWLERSL